MGDLFAFGLTAFATLFVTIGPLETAAVYATVTAGIHKPDRKKLAVRSVVVATGLLTAFGLLGNQMDIDLEHCLGVPRSAAKPDDPEHKCTAEWQYTHLAPLTAAQMKAS